jgi:hypothetical protein
MSIYDVDYSTAGKQLLPPDKRHYNMVAWVKALLKPMQWLRDLWLGSYRTGSTDAPYLITTTYNIGDRVVYKYAVYESVVNNNLGNDPLNTAYWVKVQDNFIGVMERVQYNGAVIILTYALNKYFGTVFRQPNNVSDIYITANAKPTAVFVVGFSEGESSKVYSTASSEFVINSYTFSAYVNMAIHIPLAVYNALDSDPANREKIVRNFADQYIVAGITYEVITY